MTSKHRSLTKQHENVVASFQQTQAALNSGVRRLRGAAWARELGVSRVTFWSWIAHRGLKASRVGRLTFVDERDLNYFLARHTIAHPKT